MRISDWSSDVCSSDLRDRGNRRHQKLLGASPSAGQTRLPSSRLLCADAWGTTRAMTFRFGIDRLLADPVLRKPLEGRSVARFAHTASATPNFTPHITALVTEIGRASVRERALRYVLVPEGVVP